MTNTIDNKKHLNVPPLRFPEFSGEWTEHILSEFLELKNGMNPSPKLFGRGTKFISVMDILNNQYINYDNIKASVEAKDSDIHKFGVNFGDILFQRSSETLEDIGQANVYLDDKTAVFGGFVIRGKKIGSYNPLYFKDMLSCPNVRRKIIVKGAGAQHFNIGQEELNKLWLFFPEEKEQYKIAKLFRALDDRIDIQNKIIEDLKKLKSAIIEMEYNHKTKSNSHIGDFIEQTSKRNKACVIQNVLSVSNRHGFIQQSEQFENRNVASDNTSNYKIVERNDFAFNPARINVGSIARLTTFDRGIVSPMYICFRTKDTIYPEYLDYYFESKQFFTEVQKRLEGSVRQCLSFEGLCNILLCIPTIEGQQKIGKRLSALVQEIRLEIDFLEVLQRQKKFLLHQMFI